MRAQPIADEINKKVRKTGIKNNPDFKLSEKNQYWTIGITNNLERRKQEHANDSKNVTHWNGWPADTEEITRTVEAHFLKCGMKGGGGGGQTPTYVYIF